MSVAWYVVLENNIPGFDPAVDGKALARAGDMLESIAKDKGVRPLMGYFSTSPEEISGFLEDHGATFEKAPPEEWFTAEEGLKTVNALLEEGERRQLDARAITDLRDFQRVLEVAKQNDVGWHMAVDF